MTLTQFKFDSTDGTAITAGNSGLTSIVKAGSATAIYRTAAAFQGATGAEFISDGTNACLGIATMAASASQAAASLAFKIPASAPAADYVFARFYDTASSSIIGLVYRSTGAVSTSDKNSTLVQILSAAQATAGTWFRFELVVTNLSATVGAFTCRAYNSSGTQVGSTASSTTANTGTTALNTFRVGALSAAVFTADIDSLQLNNGASTEIGPIVGNTTLPTIAVIANQTISNPAASVSFTAVPTAYNGDTISSYAWTLVSGPNSPTLSGSGTATVSFTPGAGVTGRYLLQVTVTDSSGNVSLPRTVKAFSPATAITPLEVTSNSGWTLSAIGNLTDASDGTYADSGASGSGNQLVIRLNPLVDSPTGFSLDIRHLVTATGGTQTVELLDGATSRKTWTLSPAVSAADAILTLTSGEIATVSQWNELDLRFTQA